MFKKIIKNNQGVSLMEMLVAISIFILISLMATSIFQQVLRSQRAAIASQNVQESMRYSMEVVSKEIRNALLDKDGSYCGNTGRIYTTSADGTELYLLNQNGDCVAYFLDETTSRLKIERAPLVGDPKEAFVMPDDIAVSNLKFEATDDPESSQSKVTMTMRIVSLDEQNPQTLNLETTISSRYYGGEL